MSSNKERGGAYKPAPEKNPDGLTPQQRETAEHWLAQGKDETTPKESLRDCEEEVSRFESMLAAFEAEHDLEALRAIVDLRPEDAYKYPIRERAKAALIPIVAALNGLEHGTNIAPDRFATLRAKYRVLSRPFGFGRLITLFRDQETARCRLF